MESLLSWVENLSREWPHGQITVCSSSLDFVSLNLSTAASLSRIPAILEKQFLEQAIGITDYSCVQVNDWEIDLEPQVPQQTNDYDCGVFLMMSMHALVGNTELPKQQSVESFRCMCLTECVQGSILH